MAVKLIPNGFHTLTPYLTVEGAPKLLDFLSNAFDATSIRRAVLPDGTIMNVEVKIGDSIVMISEARGEYRPNKSAIYLYVQNADATYKRAIEAGASSLSEPSDEFWGDRVAGVKDLSGNDWWIATHIEDVAAEEIQRRVDAFANN
ncbi:glyoxalase [Calothrix sp. HK-06]|nr:glyoxalase [Calothrix sp. HK-06]